MIKEICSGGFCAVLAPFFFLCMLHDVLVVAGAKVWKMLEHVPQLWTTLSEAE